MTPTRAKVKLATYSATDSVTSNKSLQNTYIGRSRRELITNIVPIFL